MAGLIDHFIEMTGRGIAGVSGGTLNYTSTTTPLDTSLYDSATYYLEVIYINKDVANRTLTLFDDASTSITTLTLIGSTTAETRLLSASFTPTSGAHTYFLQTPKVGTNNNVVIYNARIRIVQTDAATTSRISVPLIVADNTGFVNSDVGTPTDTTNSTTYTQANPIGYPIWLLDKSKFSTIASGTPWTFEATFRTRSAGQTASVALFDRTSGTMVTSAEVTTTGDTNPHNVSVSFSDANMTDGHEYEIRAKTSSGTANCDIFRASVHVTLTNPTKAELAILASKQFTGANSYLSPDMRYLYTSANYANPKIYFEVTGSTLANSPTAALTDMGASDSSTTGTDVTGTTLTPGGTKARTRSSAITLTDGDRYDPHFVGTASTNAQFCSCYILIQVSETITTTQTQTGKSRITASTSQTQTGKARVQESTTQTQSGKSRITAATTKTQTGRARVTAKATKTQAGKARVQESTAQTVSGVARIQESTSQVQTGRTRITAVATQTQTGKSRIQESVTQTQTGVARLTAVTTRTQTGKARVQESVAKTQTGVSRIQKAVSRTTTGLARITAVTTQTITGRAFIAGGTQQIMLLGVGC